MHLPGLSQPERTGSVFFLERTKEFLPIGAQRRPRAGSLMGKVFLLLFLQKKKGLAFLPKATERHQVHMRKAGLSDGMIRQVNAQAHAQIPMGRSGTADEIAKTVLFFASDDAAYVTGAELPVDGGWAQV